MGPEVLLGGDGQVAQVVEGAHVRRTEAGAGEGGLVDGGPGGPGERLAQPLELQRLQPVAGQELRGIPDAALGGGHHPEDRQAPTASKASSRERTRILRPASSPPAFPGSSTRRSSTAVFPRWPATSG